MARAWRELHCRITNEAAEGAVKIINRFFANAQAKGQAQMILLERGLLQWQAHRRGKRCIASVNLSGKADNGVPLIT
jgi:hypothetical protein